MIEFLQTLTKLQWILIGGGVFLVFPVVRDFLISKLRKNPAPHIKTTTDSHDLTSIVHKWELLYDACNQAGLKEATAKLRVVFPTLVELPVPPNSPEPNNEVPGGTNE